MKNKVLSIMAILLLLAVLYAIGQSAPTSTNSAGAVRIAYVDIAAITEKAVFVQDLKKKIDSDYDAKLKQYKIKQDQYAKLVDEINRQQSVMSETAMNDKYKQAFLFKAQLDEEKFAVDKFVDESEKKKVPALNHILEVVQQVAQEEGCDVVIRREYLIYGHPANDISDKVIARLNSAPATPAF